MKLAYLLYFSILFNIFEAYQYGSDVSSRISAFHKREDELPPDVYVKQAVPVAAPGKQAGPATNASADEASSKIRPPYYYNQYQCELCCNGTRLNGLFPRSVSCCGNTTFDYNTALCCKGKVVHFKPTPYWWQWQCCGRELYNTVNQLCCKDEVHDKGYLEQCCGRKKFNASIQVCCGDKILPKPSYETWACCGTKTYDTTKQKCVDGKIINKKPGELPYLCGKKIINFAKYICCNGVPVLKVDQYTLCCGKEGYQSKKEICCEDKVFEYDGTGTQGCCGNELMDVTKYKCCNGFLYDMPSGKDCYSYICCGSELYNYQSQTALCCGDQVVEIDAQPYEFYNYQCCGSDAYNTQTETCCNRFKTDPIVIHRPNAVCCGNKDYDPSYYTCCNNTLFPVGEVPLKMCCCPNNDCNQPYYPFIK